MPTISVIVPVYNVEKYLVRCINSVLAQTFTDFELILVDDGANDNSGRICDEYLENNINIMVVHKKNAGLASARCIGIESSSGRYISFCDSDDYLDYDFLERLYETMSIYDCQCVSSFFKKIENNTTTNVFLKNLCGYHTVSNNRMIEYDILLLQNYNGWELCTKLFDVEIIKKSNLLTFYLDTCNRTGSFGEDLCFYLMYIVFCKAVCHIDYFGYNYCFRSNSITQSEKHIVKLNEINEISMCIYSFLSKNMKDSVKDYPKIHLWLLNHALIQINQKSDISLIRNSIQNRKWFCKMTLNALKETKTMLRFYDANYVFDFCNLALYMVHGVRLIYSISEYCYYHLGINLPFRYFKM